jgi:replicative DNA helicase
MSNTQPKPQKKRNEIRVVTSSEAGWGSQEIPYSQEAEEAVIGAILVNPVVYYSVATFLNADDFFILRHKYIWQGLQRLAERNEPIDYLTLVQALRDVDKLAEIGGPAYLTQLINSTPTSTHAEVYGRLVERAATRRRLMAASDEIKALALNEELAIEQVLHESYGRLMDVSEGSILNSTTSMQVAISEYFGKVEGRVDARERGETVSLGVPTGLRELDERINGLLKGTVTIVGGVSGMGKTSFLLTVALNASRLGARVLFVPLERDREWVINRLTAMETGISRSRINKGDLTKQEWMHFVEASNQLSKLRITIYERPRQAGWQLSPQTLLTTATAVSYEKGIDLLIVDHMSLMTSGIERIPPGSYQDKAYVSSSIPHIASTLNVPVLIAAQVNMRRINQRSMTRRRPELGDLEYVGEKDMDTCLFLYRDAKYNKKAKSQTLTEIIIPKNRDSGWEGTVFAEYNGERYLDATSEEHEFEQMGDYPPKKSREPQDHWSGKY